MEVLFAMDLNTYLSISTLLSILKTFWRIYLQNAKAPYVVHIVLNVYEGLWATIFLSICEETVLVKKIVDKESKQLLSSTIYTKQVAMINVLINWGKWK